MEEKEIKETANANPEDICDSIAIGSASKGGIVKIYGNFENVEAFKKKIDNAKEAQQYAQANLMVNI